MINPSHKLVMERWDALPDSIREALCSDVNTDFIWRTAEGEHIPDDSIYDISRLSGYVLFGFLHPEDLSEELQKQAGIHKESAEIISNAIGSRIFDPLKNEIDKIYSPVSQLDSALNGQNGQGPKMMRDIGLPSQNDIPQPKPNAPIQIPTPSQIPMSLKTPMADAKGTAQPAPPMAPPKPVADLPVSQAPLSSIGGNKSATSGLASSSVPSPAGAPVPPPTILERNMPKPEQKKQDFRLNIPSRGVDMEIGKKAAAPPPIKAAVIEFGAQSDKPKYATPVPSAPVSSVNTAPITPSAKREFTEITETTMLKPTVTKAPTPPVPPAAPVPPTAPAIKSETIPVTSKFSETPKPPIPPKPPAPPIPPRPGR